jgi:fatty acid synthase subunit alpha
VPENGREIDGLHDKSELSHHIMTLVNLLRILGAVKTKKASRHFVTRPTQVILLLSLNHGLFGNDGLYLESKISLEMLFNRWNSESWSEYCAWLVLLSRKYRFNFLPLLDGLCYIGGPAVQVSWDKVERHSIRTFSAKEMVFNILGMMHPLLLLLPRLSPSGLTSIVVWIVSLTSLTSQAYIHIHLNKNELRRAIMRDNALDFKVINEAEDGRIKNKKASRHFVTRPTQVIQSSSSNHRTQNALPRPSPPNYESFAFVVY